LQTKLIDDWLLTGAVKKGRAVDKPEIKSSGYEVIVEKAFKHKLPYTIASLNPLPVLKREDYIAHLFIYHKYAPYEIFPEKYFAYIDNINLNVAKFLNSEYVEFTNLFNKTEEEKLMDIENLDDPVMRELVEERLEVIDKNIKKNKVMFKYAKPLEEHYKRLGHQYYIKTLCELRQNVQTRIL
jgi:hypothetical protein